MAAVDWQLQESRNGWCLNHFGHVSVFQQNSDAIRQFVFCGGIPLTIGPSRTMSYFMRREKAGATACLALGILLVFSEWPAVGIVLEAFGLLNLFGKMFPVAMAILKNMPVIGPILKGGGGKKNNRDRYDDDRYYDRGYYNQGYNDRYYPDDRDDGTRGYYWSVKVRDEIFNNTYL